MTIWTTVKTSLPVELRKSAKVARVTIAERFGSERYSHPALNDLDRKVRPYLPATGVFLEVGANDGYSQSNTYYLERFCGWEGILIEPMPSPFSRCEALRRRSKCFNVACTATTEKIAMVDIDLMSVPLGQQLKDEEVERLARGREHPCTVMTDGVPISSVIDLSGYRHIDFMSVDVEGAELPLLAGLDLSRHTPSWLLIETAHMDQVADVLRGHLAVEVQLTHHDYLLRALRD